MSGHSRSVFEEGGLYDPRFDHDGCGVGFVAHLDGVPRHSVIQQALSALQNLEHRGARGGDRSTGDGSGLLLQIPDTFFRRCQLGFRLPAPGHYAVGCVFLPGEERIAGHCRWLFEKVAEEEGCEILGWRKVPVDDSSLGHQARAAQPRIEQVFVARGRCPREDFERKLYVIRRRVEKEVLAFPNADPFYIPSLSPRTIVYKGMLTASQLASFYLDFQDESFASSFCLFHERYSTNTLPAWYLAQPFRFLAHNGEINTLRGNINRMRAREAKLQSQLLGDDLEKIKPILDERGSDSAMLDNILELLVLAGRSLPHAMMMLIPEACSTRINMSEDKRAFYEYHAALMEPWDGPAAVAFTDGRYLGATLDRNGLRPARYTVTKDGFIILASETGVLPVEPERILRRGRLQPGKLFLVDLEQHRVVPDNEIKSKIARQKPYRRWLTESRIVLRGMFSPAGSREPEPEVLLRLQHVFGYTEEELRMILSPMASHGQEPVGSMGNDAALAVLSDRPQLLFAYFKQLFAQVTNPPIDPLREELVMSLESFLGKERNLLDETPQHNRGVKLYHPILTPDDLDRIRSSHHPDLVAREIDMLFPAGGDGRALERALQALFAKAEQAVREGVTLLILTDRRVDVDHAPIPSLLAASGLHHHLIRRGLRNDASIIVETGEAREVMHFALLIAYGTDAICPYLAFQTIHQLARQRLLEGDRRPEEAMDNYITAIKKGLLKTMSRMGISTLHSFFGSQIFEALGLGKEVVDRYFTGTPSRIGGIGLGEIARESTLRHRQGFPLEGRPPKLLDVGGAYHAREGGEAHLWSTEAIYKLQQAVRNDDYAVFKEYTRIADDPSRRITLRSLLRFKKGKPIPIDEVEPVESIVKRFVAAAMSFGSLSREAHETIAIAMNRLGARSNSGEGGEDPARYIPLPNGDSRCSAVKQVASGRFGVTTEYLIHAEELQIKIAQGAKPGEGGQLPGHKVTPEIARVRHTTPGVTLISPPPHHDIYSIEDLAQLIYDLKSVNPRARVSVKLVSEVGVGTIACGVAKGNADVVLISGHDGGTGASPLSAIKHTGLPWELGLAETQQALIRNRLRDRIRIQVDGQLKTGRDVVIAALLGAEEFGFGTAVLVTLGCVLLRKCHLNACSMGVATQNPELREHFAGKPEYVERFFRFLAQEVREYMAELGFRTVDEMVGRVEMLEVDPEFQHWKASKLDLSAILVPPPPDAPRRCLRSEINPIEPGLNATLLEVTKKALERKEKVKVRLPIRNVDRAVGATLSGEIVRRYGSKGLPDGTIEIEFYGSAGQSFGAFLAPGVTLRLEGDANDYLGKGMSGGRIIVVPPKGSSFVPHENVIVGNVVLYGATGGEVFINGLAGERFAVRNSGAVAVVEGVGDHGCEYMTGGIVVVLGPTGNNFAAGMSGGIAYVYDPTELFDTRCNLDMVDLETVWDPEDERVLRSLVEKHHRLTGSPLAGNLLANWQAHLPLFVKVMPIDYRKSLERMKVLAERDTESVPATEEVYNG